MRYSANTSNVRAFVSHLKLGKRYIGRDQLLQILDTNPSNTTRKIMFFAPKGIVAIVLRSSKILC